MFYKTLIVLTFLNLLLFTSNTGVSGSFDFKEIAANTPSFESAVQISPYDKLFKSISESEGNDWRLLCAMAYHESRFQTDVVSRCGARGIMQVMPNVARQFDVSVEQLTNVEDNIYVANRVMTLIEQMLKLPASVSADDRMKLTIAAYNCGIGRVTDARRLARSFGEDSTSWVVVAKYLEKMELPEYYQNEVVKYGRFSGSKETLAYVRNVARHYQDYCLLAMR